MTNTFRNRLVGSIIVAAAGIIIIPSLFDGQKSSYKDDFKAVPVRPEFNSVQTAKVEAFPDKTFEQNLPAATASQEDEMVLDAEPVQTDNSSNQVAIAQDNKTVLDTDNLSVAVISKPTDFSGDPLTAKAEPKAIPKAVPVKKSQPVEVVAKISSPTRAKAKPKTSAFATSAWVIQLGAFSQKSNAQALEKTLNAAGYVTFSRAIVNKSRHLTKVYVGPELDRAVLEKALSKVNRVASVKGTITSFTVKR
jgi:DedD protein